MTPAIKSALAQDPRRLIHFLTDGIQPPGPAYVSQDDALLVIINNSAAGFAVGLNRRFLAPDGQILSQSDTLTPASDRSGSVFTIQNAEGFLLGLTCTPSGTARRGQCYVKIVLVRNAGSLHSQLLTSGYVSSTDELGWPGGLMVDSTDGTGNIRSITGTTPAAAAEISETVPTGARWRLLSIRFGLTTSAVVAARATHFIIDDGANTLVAIDPAATIAASLSRTFDYAGGLPCRQSPAGSDDLYSLPVPLILRPGFRLRTNTPALQPGDQYTAPQYLVEEWIEI